MKKIFIILIFIAVALPSLSVAADITEDSVKNCKNPIKMSFFGENIAASAIKHALKKEAPGRYKVKIKGYSLSSMKKGVFKYLEITGRHVNANEIEIPFFNIKTVTDYNRIDLSQNSVIIKSDMVFDCNMRLSEKSVNDALETEEYNKVLRKINKKMFPILTLNKVNIKIKNDRMHITMSYNFPLAPREKDRTFTFSSGINIANNEIRPSNISFDTANGNLPLSKVTSLINMLNPLNYTIKFLGDNQCDIKIEQAQIVDDNIIINGKIYIKGDV